MTLGWQAFGQTVAKRGDHPALLLGDIAVSFADLGQLACQVAAGLSARGVGAGDRVVLHLGNGPAAAALPAALWSLGAAPVLAPADLRPEAVAGIATRVAARGVISDTLDTCNAAPVWRAGDLAGIDVQVADDSAAAWPLGAVPLLAAADVRAKSVAGMADHSAARATPDTAPPDWQAGEVPHPAAGAADPTALQPCNGAAAASAPAVACPPNAVPMLAKAGQRAETVAGDVVRRAISGARDIDDPIWHAGEGQGLALAADHVARCADTGSAAVSLPEAAAPLDPVPLPAPMDPQPGAAAERGDGGLIPHWQDTTAPVWRGGVVSDAVGSIVFTSGSTGRPKGVVQLQSTLVAGAGRVAQAVGFGPDDRVLSAVPWSHDYGWTQLLALYVLGLTLVLPATPGLAGVPLAMERHRVTVLGGVPSVYAGLTRGVSDIATRDRSTVRLVMSTGSPMPARVWDDLAVLFPQARRVLNYGLTETFRSATLRAEDEGLAPRVTGSALPGSGLVIVDPEGRPLPPGEWGEIVHRGAGVFEGYWDDPVQTALCRRPDPVTGQGHAVFTGDRGMLDRAGRLTVGDRIDRMVKVMGLTASPAEIEEVLRAVPGVVAAAVVFRAHEILGTELHAVLVGEGVRPAAEAACRASLPAHARPRKFHLRQALPLTASGKVDLVALTREIAV